MQDKFTSYSHGKLLLTAEYLVMDGAKALAIPCAYGQFFKAKPIVERILRWKSLTFEGNCWFEEEFLFSHNSIIPTTSSPTPEHRNITERLQQLFSILFELIPDFFSTKTGFQIETLLEFPKNWGLGSSSTLIYSLAKWTNTNPYILLAKSFGGSGYDIACAGSNKPLLFQLKDQEPIVEKISFKPSFKKQLFFVHLNKKMNSRKAIQHYKQQDLSKKAIWVEEASSLTAGIVNSTSIEEFEQLITQHEKLIGAILNTPPIKEELFNDYPRAIKSLGGWGGDFILATGGEDEKKYFRERNFQTIIDYKKMVL